MRQEARDILAKLEAGTLDQESQDGFEAMEYASRVILASVNGMSATHALAGLCLALATVALDYAPDPDVAVQHANDSVEFGLAYVRLRRRQQKEMS